MWLIAAVHIRWDKNRLQIPQKHLLEVELVHGLRLGQLEQDQKLLTACPNEINVFSIQFEWYLQIDWQLRSFRCRFLLGRLRVGHNLAGSGVCRLLLQYLLAKSVNGLLPQANLDLIKQALEYVDVGDVVNSKNFNRDAVLFAAEGSRSLLFKLFGVGGVFELLGLLGAEGGEGLDVREPKDVALGYLLRAEGVVALDVTAGVFLISLSTQG